MVAIAEVYLDESGSHESSPFLTVGGYLFLRSKSKRFSREWKAELARAKVPFFHMADLATGNSDFRDWSMERRIKFETSLINMTKKYSAFGFATTVCEQEFKEVFKNFPKRRQSAYAFLLNHALHVVKGWADSNKFQGKIAYFFEAGHRDSSQANSIMNDLFRQPTFKDYHRYFSHAFVDKTEAAPLQCADLLSWLSRNSVLKFVTNKPPRLDLIALKRDQDTTKYYDRETLLACRAHLRGDKEAFKRNAMDHYFWQF